MADNGNGKPDAEAPALDRIYILTLTFNEHTFQVSIGGEAMPVSLAQMIVGEAMRLLEETRRLDVAQQLKAQMEQNLRDQAIFDRVRKEQ